MFSGYKKPGILNSSFQNFSPPDDHTIQTKQKLMPLYNPFQKTHFSCVWNTVFGCFQHTVFVCFCLNRFFWFVLRQWNFIIHLLKLWNNFILTLAWKTPLTWAVYLAQPKRKLLHAQAVIRGLNTKIQHLTVITVEKRLKWLKTPKQRQRAIRNEITDTSETHYHCKQDAWTELCSGQTENFSD